MDGKRRILRKKKQTEQPPQPTQQAQQINTFNFNINFDININPQPIIEPAPEQLPDDYIETDEVGMPLTQRSDIPILKPMIKFMKNALRIAKVSDELAIDIFNDKRLDRFNKNKSNIFGFDKYGLIIRKEEFNNPKSIYGWVKNEANEAISIHIQPELLRMSKTKEEIFDLTMLRIYAMFPKDTKQTNSQFVKIFKLFYSDKL